MNFMNPKIKVFPSKLERTVTLDQAEQLVAQGDAVYAQQHTRLLMLTGTTTFEKKTNSHVYFQKIESPTYQNRGGDKK